MPLQIATCGAIGEDAMPSETMTAGKTGNALRLMLMSWILTKGSTVSVCLSVFGGWDGTQWKSIGNNKVRAGNG